MRITVFGAAGSVGSRVVNEALARGHEVVAVVRKRMQLGALPPTARSRIGDASKVADVVALSQGQDVVISATRPREGSESALVATARSLVAGTRETRTRLVVVGGAATLAVPGKGGLLVLDDPEYISSAWRPIAEACRDQHDVFRGESDVDWTYVSPPALLESGPRLGAYRLGQDELVLDNQGVSRISVEDFAVALLDEVEQPRHQRARFTVAY